MDEYLWNKTGSDPEIEQIEAALKGLAYRPTAPPVLPAKQLVFTAPRRWPFRLGFSFATAFLALVALGSGWFLLRNEPTATQAVVTISFKTPVIPVRTEPTAPVLVEAPKGSTPSKPQRRMASPRSRARDPIRPQTLVLTKEEADAYRQLMTALNITSTNLKIVKDKLDGTE